MVYQKQTVRVNDVCFQYKQKKSLHTLQEKKQAASFNHGLPRDSYREVPLTGCQLSIAPHYLRPQSFGQDFALGDEGEADDTDIPKLPGLPWVFKQGTGELLHFLTDMTGNVAEAADFQKDAIVFERCFGLDVRYLHHHLHTHECCATCVKNVKTD